MNRPPAEELLSTLDRRGKHSRSHQPLGGDSVAQREEGESCTIPTAHPLYDTEQGLCRQPLELPADVASLDQYHAEWARLTAEMWHMLAVDPVAAMLDKSCFRRLCEGIPYETILSLLEHWANEWWPTDASAISSAQMSDLAMEHESWMLIGKSGVLPVGREAILNHPGIGITGLEGAERFADAFAPFDGDLYAIVILRGHFGRTTCDAFCLAHGDTWDGTSGHNDELNQFDYWTANGDVRYFISGDPEVDDLTIWRDQVQAWWRSMAGLRLQLRGRPKGTTRFQIEDVVRMLDQYLSSLPHGESPSKCAFLEFAGIPLTSWKRYTKRWGTSWTKLSSNHRRS